jgi:hypothetical protein
MESLVAACDRLFERFLAPLVLGGAVRPAKPFGGLALKLSKGALSDRDGLSRAELARVRIARKLAPVDGVEAEPSDEEWALAAVLHDLVQSTHPDFDAAFRRQGPARILAVVEPTLARILPPRTVKHALSRHTWFSRMFDLTRTDTLVRWWTGSEKFLGREPSARLTLWPALRRVSQAETRHSLMELPDAGARVDAHRFSNLVSLFLSRTPLTDIATMNRVSPVFRWSHETLSLCATQAGRTLVGRALGRLEQNSVDEAQGRALRVLLAANATRAAAIALSVLRDRALFVASRSANGNEAAQAVATDDAAFAARTGAIAAMQWLRQSHRAFSEAEREAILRALAVRAGTE